MNTATPDEYQRFIDIGKLRLKSIHERWHEIPAERQPLARFGQGTDALFVAVGHLMLEQTQPARDWFAIAGQFFLEASRPPDTVLSEKRALECALFSGDSRFCMRVAQTVPARQEAVKPVEYPYVMFLKHAILGEYAQAAAFAEDSAWLGHLSMQQRGGYGTLQAACKALAGQQPEAFYAAIGALLEEHTNRMVPGRGGLPDGMLCFPAAALLMLARDRGLHVALESPYLPVALFQ